MNGATTRCSGSPILMLWTQWVTHFLNILSDSHLKPNLRTLVSTGFNQPKSCQSCEVSRPCNCNRTSIMLPILSSSFCYFVSSERYFARRFPRPIMVVVGGIPQASGITEQSQTNRLSYFVIRFESTRSPTLTVPPGWAARY